MDSFTQIVLGAAVGEAVLGKKIGNKAILFGAIAGTIPDLDVIARAFLGTVGALDFHRGFTHSLIFSLLVAPLLGLLLKKIYSSSNASWKDWTLLFFLGFFTHTLLDCFTTWGTQLFWPLDYRVAFKSIFVIDPLYTLPLTICLVWVLFLPKNSLKRQRLNTIGLIISSGYLVLTIFIKQHINQVFEDSFSQQNIEMVRYDTRPAPLTTLLWTANVEVEYGYYVGYYSLLDEDRGIDYFYFPKQHELLAPYIKNENVQKLNELTGGWYMLQPNDAGIIYNDLRFGQRSGWLSAEDDFVFSYTIQHHNGELKIEERAKEFNDGAAMMQALWHRIWGN